MRRIFCRLLFLGALSLGFTNLSAQDLTGIWQGHFLASSGERYKFELQLSQSSGNRISGVSYSYLTTVFYGKATLSGHFNKIGKTALVEELKTVELRMSGTSFACIMKCSFRYVKKNGLEYLEGTYTSAYEKSEPLLGIRRGADCGGGTVILQRVEQSDFYVEPFLRTKPTQRKVTPPVAQKPVPRQQTTTPNRKPATTTTSPKKTGTATARKQPENTPAARRDSVNRTVETPRIEHPKAGPRLTIPVTTRSRQNELAKTLTVQSDEVLVRLYDNGEIDDDTISVYLDGRQILSNKRLSTTPITVKLEMDEDNPEHVLVMVAENLGRIPPNTSLMIVQDGDKRYEVRITSTEQKNAMVRFRYEKP